MIEAPTSESTRIAIRAAHQARGDVLSAIIRWFRKPISSE